jgi:putative ABC transport system permease protein
VIAAVPGVRHVAAVTLIAGSLPSGAAVEVIAVNPVSYAALVASTPWPRLPAGALAGVPAPGPAGPVTAVASAMVAASFQAGPVELAAGAVRTVSARVVATISGTPALPGQDLFLILPSWALPAAPSLLLVTGDHLDQQALRAAAHRVLPHAAISLRSAALATLAGSPLQRGAVTAFALGVAAAAGFSTVILLLSLALAARDRTDALARLAAMGLTAGQARRMVVLEALPVVLAAVAAGAACGWLLAPLTGPALDLSVFTGGAVGVPIRADLTSLALPAAGLLVLALAVLSVQTLVAQTLVVRRLRAWRR